MQINAICPKCQNRYQLSSGLLGQKIRCPSSTCREVFEVREAPVEKYTPPARPKPARDRRAPSFEDAPTAEAPPGEPVAAGPSAPDWSAMPPPPVRRRDDAAPAAGKPAGPARGAAATDEVLAWMMGTPAAPAAAPAAGADEDYALPQDQKPMEEDLGPATLAEPNYPLFPEYRPKRRSSMQWVIIALIVLTAGGGGGFFFYQKQKSARREVELHDQATKLLDNKQFVNAGRMYEDLAKNYSKSEEKPKYLFLKEYCQAAAAAVEPGVPAEKRREEFSKYLTKTRDNDAQKDWLTERQNQTWDALGLIAESQAADAERKVADKKFDEADTSYLELDTALKLMRRNAPPAEKNPVPDALVARADKLNESIDVERKYSAFLKQVDELLKAPSPTVLAQIEADAKKFGHDGRPELTQKLEKAKELLRSRIVFTEDAKPPEPLPAGSGLATLVIGASGGQPGLDERAVFALARGVLYALAETDGRILWATRVGIDATALPLRVPAVGRNVPELVLVPSGEGRGLLAREVLTGRPRWFQTLPAPARGRPILFERRVYVPLTDEEGTVVLLEANDGHQVGRIKLGQRLGPGGAAQDGTTRIFLPADSQNVFVLDANPQADADGKIRSLQAVLVTGHGPGTLRGEPVIVGSDDPAGGAANTSYLILCQSDGLDAMRVKAFSFRPPIEALGLPVEVKLRGWSWFAPLCDQEKLAIVTDSGAFALLGVNQKDNQDAALFPLLVSAPPAGATLGRGQVVHMEERAFWFLANGELNMLRMGFDRREGMKLAPGWREPQKLGTPLHAAQVSADRATLFVVTQTLAPPAWLATAIDTQTGAIKWQRPLGLAPQGDPIRLGDSVYQLDQGGGLYQIDPRQINVQPGVEWYHGGQMLLAPRSDVVGSPAMLPAADGKSAYVVFATGAGKQLQVRQIVPGEPVKELPAAALPAAPAGAPLLAGNALILPLANGSLSRVVIGAKEGEVGPDWRAGGLSESARAYVISLGGDAVLVTDGHRGLSAYGWPAGQAFQLKFQQSMPDRIVSAPLVLPSKDAPPRVFIADAGGRITLLDGDPPTMTMRWETRAARLGNEITAGPFLLEGGAAAEPRVLVVVDHTLLLCLNPDSRIPAWHFKLKGDGLAGKPRRLGDSLILADVAGRFEAIDAATGAALGGSYPVAGTLPAAPAATPADFGPGRLFAPLTDGTVLIVPLNGLVPKN